MKPPQSIEESIMSAVNQLRTDEFSSEVLRSSVPVVVDVYADWCAPCRALAPVLQQSARTYNGRIKFLKVNVDEEPQLAEALQVESLPTLLFFRNGRLVDKVVGLAEEQELTARFERLAQAVPERVR
jgi:thioredoxin